MANLSRPRIDRYIFIFIFFRHTFIQYTLNKNMFYLMCVCMCVCVYIIRYNNDNNNNNNNHRSVIFAFADRAGEKTSCSTSPVHAHRCRRPVLFTGRRRVHVNMTIYPITTTRARPHYERFHSTTAAAETGTYVRSTDRRWTLRNARVLSVK